MKRSSVFVLLLVVMYSCNDQLACEISDVAGKYELKPEKKPVLERLFSKPNVTGWDYDDPCSMSLTLNSNSTYEESCYGGGFEAADYRGKWRISHDSIYLLPLFEVFGSADNEEITKLDGATEEVLRIIASGELEVCSLTYTDKGRILTRK